MCQQMLEIFPVFCICTKPWVSLCLSIIKPSQLQKIKARIWTFVGLNVTAGGPGVPEKPLHV